jgi:polyisoprenoid-binding protein YceI
MRDLKKALVLGVCAAFLLPGRASPAARTAYSIDAQASKIEIQVARDGFLKAFGHDHLVSAVKYSGEIQFDTAKVEGSSVEFTVETASLKVMDPGESEKDRNEVQATMLGEQVLDAARYPQIKFSSTSVKAGSSASQLTVDGTLTLHGVTKPCPVPVRIQVANDGTMTADAEIFLLQSDFGIAPYKAAGGTVRVKDKLALTLHIVARKASK